MIPMHVVVAGNGLDAAARREIAALAQQASPSKQATVERETQQAAPGAAPGAAQAARDARELDAIQALHSVESRLAQSPAPVAIGETRISVSPDGRTTIVYPDGRTTNIERNGRVTRINADGRITHAAGAPGENVIPNDVREISMMTLLLIAFVVVARPLTGAFGRRLERRAEASGDQPGTLQREMHERMQRIEQAVDAVAIEVERVSEGQRFTTKLLSDLRAPATIAASSSPYGGEK